MPVIHLTTPAGTFTNERRDELAEQLTTIVLTREGLPLIDFVRSTAWIYMHELSPAHVYHGGQSDGSPVTTVEVNAFDGGLDDTAKQGIINDFTDAITRAAEFPDSRSAPIYVIFRDIRPTDWGVFGTTITLNALHHPSPDAPPI